MNLSYSLVPCWIVIGCLLSMRMLSVACEAARRLVAISFSRCSGGSLSITRPCMALASLNIRSVESLSGFDSRTSVGQ
jgi:hypothetical protein